MFISSHVGLNETFKQLRAVVLAYGDLIVNYFSIQLFGDFRIILEHFSTHLSHDTWDSHTHTHTHCHRHTRLFTLQAACSVLAVSQDASS